MLFENAAEDWWPAGGDKKKNADGGLTGRGPGNGSVGGGGRQPVREGSTGLEGLTGRPLLKKNANHVKKLGNGVSKHQN